MNQQKPSTNSKNLIVFLGMTIVIVLGTISFFIFSTRKDTVSSPKTKEGKTTNDGFLGEEGESLQASNGNLYINEDQVKDGNLHAFNFYSERKEKTIYFFIVKASDGTYRAAANACEVCSSSKKGFRQIGNAIRCENCRTTYSKDQIALEKGGCNPGPINKNVTVKNGQLVLDVNNVEAVSYLF